VAAAPITALIAEADVAKTVVDAAIVAHVPAPIAAVKAVAVMVEAPVAGGPECTLIRSLDPCAGHPVETLRSPGPIAGCPYKVVAGGGWLVVIRQRRRGRGCVLYRLLSVSGIIRILVGCLVIAIALVLRRRILLVAGNRSRCVLR
jgi:hypothetical protein